MNFRDYCKNIKNKLKDSTDFTMPIERITKPEKLAEILAHKTRILREFLTEHIESSETNLFKKRLIGLYDIFKSTLIENLKIADFIDTYAQTITYGLFFARLNSDKGIDKNTAFLYIPKSLGVIEELFAILRLSSIPDNISWIVDDIIAILNQIDIISLQKDLSFTKTINYEDPYVYFYENFLAEYDKKKRKLKGVYYTPIPVVHFIIKSIDRILQNEFDKIGFGDEGIKVLDFATGTGTFLLETFKDMLAKVDKSLRPTFIKEKILKNFYGFEYMIAPYVIAHLKLSQYLEEQGYKFNHKDEKDRLKIYLTDTLDDAKYPISNDVKLDNSILVIMGNPPYSNHSSNHKPFIKVLIEEYKRGLNEKKINLDDDYIKFIRYAQCKIEGCKYTYLDKNKIWKKGEIKALGKGIIGIITNNSYLDGITHRQMRKSLFETFDKIYILNLNGNSIKGEPDKNVFDIRVGVSIVIFVKLDKPLPMKEKKIYYYSMLENNLLKREEKFNFLLQNDIDSVKWKILKPKKPNYWFVKKDLSLQSEYNKGWSLIKIFEIYGSGVKTDRDRLYIDLDKEELSNRIKLLLSSKYTMEFIKKYRIENSSSYHLLHKIKNKTFKESFIKKVHYRTLDFRFIYYDYQIISRANYNIMQHFLDRENLGLAFTRQIVSKKWQHCFVIDKIAEAGLLNEWTYIAPLYLYIENNIKKSPDNTHLFEDLAIIKVPNFTKEFNKFIEKQYSFIPTPEQILGYIYAILYSPSYREKYNEFLKIDYPKIPFT